MSLKRKRKLLKLDPINGEPVVKRFLACLTISLLMSVDASAALPVVFTDPVDNDGCGAHMQGNGMCLLLKPFFLFEVAKFESTTPRDGHFSVLNKIELKYERNYATNMNMAVSAIKDAESFLIRRFNGTAFDREETAESYTSNSCNVDGCGWCAEFSVHKDMKRDKYEAKALFRKQMTVDHEEKSQDLCKGRTRVLQGDSYSNEDNIIDLSEVSSNLYVVVVTNSLNVKSLELGIQCHMIDALNLKDKSDLNLSSRCVLVIMPQFDSEIRFTESLVHRHGIQVACISSSDICDQELRELKILISLIIRDIRAEMIKENTKGTLDERIAMFKTKLSTDFFGPYCIRNLSLVETVEYLLLRINRDLRPYSEFSLGGGVSIGGDQENVRYDFQIPRAHVAEIFSYAATQMNCTVTNENGFIFFSSKSKINEDQSNGK